MTKTVQNTYTTIRNSFAQSNTKGQRPPQEREDVLYGGLYLIVMLKIRSSGIQQLIFIKNLKFLFY